MTKKNGPLCQMVVRLYALVTEGGIYMDTDNRGGQTFR